MKKIPPLWITFNFWVLLGVFFLFSASCQKDTDKSPPEIVIYGPPVNEEVIAGDSVRVVALVTDDRALNSIQVSLVKDQGINATTPRILYPESKSFEMDLLYPVDNPGLEDGSYEILVIADDGTNRSRKYRPVMIRGLQTRVENFILVKRLNSQVSRIEILDPALLPDTIFNIQQRYLMSEVNSRFGLFYYVKESPSVLYAHNTLDYKIEWERPAGVPYPEYIHSETGDYLFLSTGNGNIFGFDGQGDNVFQTPAFDSFIPETFHVMDDYVVAEQFARNGQERFLVIYFRATGTEKNRINIQEDVIAISSSGETALIFQNDGEEGVIRTLDPTELIYTEKERYGWIKFNTITRVDGNNFLVATQERVFNYSFQFGYLEEFAVHDAGVIRYEPLSGYVFIVEGKKMFIYDYASGLQVGELESVDEIVNMHILYNN